MDVTGDILGNISPATIVAVCVVSCLLFLLGLAADIFLIVHFAVKPPPVDQWKRRLRVRPWTWREFTLVTLSLVILHLVLGFFLHVSYAGEMPKSETFLLRTTALAATVLHVPPILLVAYVLIRKRLSMTRAFGIRLRTVPGDVAKGALSYLAIFLPILLVSFAYMQLLRAFGCDTEPQEVIKLLREAESPITIAALTFIAVVAAPVVEEVIFRGIMLPFLAKHMSVGSAVLLVSFVFAAIHLHVPALVPIFLLAIGLSLSYIATGSLTVPIITHACFNAIGLAVSLVFKDVPI